jgi:nucleotide-binding universal stress UspA family protein
MSIFPTKILLATDGSEEARLAAQAAAELSKGTGSEVHVAYVLPSLMELRGHHVYSAEVMQSVLEQAEGEARTLLEEQAKEVEASGGKVAETHLETGKPDRELVRLSEELDVGTIVIGSRGLGAIKRALMGGVCDQTRPLPGVRGTRVRDDRPTTGAPPKTGLSLSREASVARE